MAPPPKSRAPLIVGIIAATVLALCGICTVGLVLLPDPSDDDGGSSVSTSRTASPSPSPSPSAEEAPADIEDVGVGDCLKDSDADPDEPMVPAACSDPGTYTVVKRFEGTLDTGKCDTPYNYSVDFPFGEEDDLLFCIEKENG